VVLFDLGLSVQISYFRFYSPESENDRTVTGVLLVHVVWCVDQRWKRLTQTSGVPDTRRLILYLQRSSVAVATVNDASTRWRYRRRTDLVVVVDGRSTRSRQSAPQFRLTLWTDRSPSIQAQNASTSPAQSARHTPYSLRPTIVRGLGLYISQCTVFAPGLPFVKNIGQRGGTVISRPTC